VTWDPVWEKIFRERAEWGKYPPEELIRFVARYYYSVAKRSAIRILETGCGPGGGPGWYVAREGFSYSGIDGSPTAIEKARKRFAQEGLAGELVVGGLERLPWPVDTFDAVIDVACLQCNSQADTAAIVREIYRVLKPGGRHFSLTARAECWGDGNGEQVDPVSYRDVNEGPFANMGVIRFASRESLVELYAGFRDLEFEYSERSMNGCEQRVSNWIVTCRK
jgi:SAM-dependent methyltransferase